MNFLRSRGAGNQKDASISALFAGAIALVIWGISRERTVPPNSSRNTLPARKIAFGDRLIKSLGLLVNLLAVLSFFVAVDYFHSDNQIETYLGPQIRVVNWSKLSANINPLIAACIRTKAELPPQTTDGLLLAHFIQGSGDSSPAPKGWLGAQPAIGTKVNGFTDEDRVTYSEYVAGYAKGSRSSLDVSEETIFASPIQMQQFLFSRFGSPIVDFSSSPAANFFPGDVFRDCISASTDSASNVAAYYNLAEFPIWSPAIISNSSAYPTTDVLVSVMHGGELLQKLIVAEGGEILPAGGALKSFRFPVIAPRRGKLFLIKSLRPLQRDEIHVEYVPHRGPSWGLIGIGGIFVLLLSLSYLIFFSNTPEPFAES